MSRPVRYLSLDGQVVPYEQGSIHMLTPAVKYGAAVFEGIRGYWNAKRNEIYLFRLEDHLRRMQFAMKLMCFDEIFTIEKMQTAIIDLIKANEFRETVHIRMFAYLAGDGELTATGPIGLAIAAVPRNEGQTQQGIHACVSSWRRISDTTMPARLKCISNYHNSRMAGMEAKRNGYGYALLLNDRGKVAEGQTSAFFIVRNGIVVTPAVTEDILESITRDTLLRILRDDLGAKTEERTVDRSEIYDAEEAWFCGTGPEIVPVLSIDRHQIGDGNPAPLTQRMTTRYRQIAGGEVADHPAWRTPVYG